MKQDVQSVQEMLNKVIEFTEEGLDQEEYNTMAFDPGMQARVTSVTEKEGRITVSLDMSEFIKHNTKQMKANWEDRSGQRILRWNQTSFYPTDHKTTLIFFDECCPFILRSEV